MANIRDLLQTRVEFKDTLLKCLTPIEIWALGIAVKDDEFLTPREQQLYMKITREMGQAGVEIERCIKQGCDVKIYGTKLELYNSILSSKSSLPYLKLNQLRLDVIVDVTNELGFFNSVIYHTPNYTDYVHERDYESHERAARSHKVVAWSCDISAASSVLQYYPSTAVLKHISMRSEDKYSVYLKVVNKGGNGLYYTSVLWLRDGKSCFVPRLNMTQIPITRSGLYRDCFTVQLKDHTLDDKLILLAADKLVAPKWEQHTL